jgi:hypothetical protein
MLGILIFTPVPIAVFGIDFGGSGVVGLRVIHGTFGPFGGLLTG